AHPRVRRIEPTAPEVSSSRPADATTRRQYHRAHHEGESSRSSPNLAPPSMPPVPHDAVAASLRLGRTNCRPDSFQFARHLPAFLAKSVVSHVTRRNRLLRRSP